MITLPLILTWSAMGAAGALGGILMRRAYTKVTHKQALMQQTLDEHHQILKGEEL